MKKFLASILSIVYLVSTTGFAIHMQYCMGRPSGVGLGYQTSGACARCGMENKKGCCHSEVKIVKLTADQQRVASGLMFPAFSPVTASSDVRDFSGLLTKGARPMVFSHSPPGKYFSKVYLLCSVFKI